MQTTLAKDKPKKVMPLLMQRAVPRTGDSSIPGQYNVEQQVWAVNGLPLVTSGTLLAELSTKTDAQIERDDISPRFILEMQTKTKAQVERDD